MKKILLVLMLIFLGHSAFSMYCWEEKSAEKNHTSAMTSKLGASNIVKVSTLLTAAYAREVRCYTDSSGSYYASSCANAIIGANVSTAEYENGITHGAPTVTNSFTYSYNGSVPTPVSAGGYSSYRLYSHIQLGSDYSSKTTEEDKWNYWYGSSLLGIGWNTSNNAYYAWYYKDIKYIEYVSPYYTHTFCTTADGGGGGAAGAAVNYIIKAD